MITCLFASADQFVCFQFCAPPAQHVTGHPVLWTASRARSPSTIASGLLGFVGGSSSGRYGGLIPAGSRHGRVPFPCFLRTVKESPEAVL